MNRSASTRSKHERQLPLPAALVDRNHSPSTRRQIGWILRTVPAAARPWVRGQSKMREYDYGKVKETPSPRF